MTGLKIQVFDDKEGEVAVLTPSIGIAEVGTAYLSLQTLATTLYSSVVDFPAAHKHD